MKRHTLWIGAAAILCIVFGTNYMTVQQSERAAANYPQLQLAQDAAVALNNSKLPSNVVSGSVDMNQSLAPFVVVYDKSGKPIAGSGLLDSKLPIAPIGILIAAQNKDYHRVTWQPRSNIRFATVTVAADNYYVLSARSLKYVEQSEAQSLQLDSIGLVGSLLVLGVLYTTSKRRGRK